MKGRFLFVIYLFFTAIVRAQDPHFSQYFASPLSVNPANTGFFDGTTRISFNNRQQWFNVGSTYSTTSISADTKLFEDRLPENDTFALGVMGLFDNSLSGILQSNYLSLSAAYHKSLGYEGRHMLTLGVQGTYANLYVDYSKLSFASQFDGFGFNTSLPVNSGISSTNAKYLDVHAGLLYQAHLYNIDMYAGASLYHIARPTVSLFSANGERLPYRTTFHAGSDFHISPASSILFSGLYMAQGGARDKMLGGAYGLHNPDSEQNFSAYLGMWVRFNDSIIPYAGVDYGDFSVGLNYSTTYNTRYNYSPAAVEISLTYRSKKNNSLRSPRF